MPTVASLPRVHPLGAYEPRAPQADTTARIPQQRPAGQLSLNLWASAPAEPDPGTGLDKAKVRAILAALVEVHGGYRPLRQLSEALTPKLYQQLATPRPCPDRRYTLKRTHIRQHTAETVEACGLIHDGERALATCAVFQLGQHGWLCTEFDILQPRR